MIAELSGDEGGSDDPSEPQEAASIYRDAGGPDSLAFKVPLPLLPLLGLELSLPPRKEWQGLSLLGHLYWKGHFRDSNAGPMVASKQYSVKVGAVCRWAVGIPALVAHICPLHLWISWA